MKQIKFEELTKAQQQAFCDFQLKEAFRHIDDIKDIFLFLDMAKNKHGIEAQYILVDTRID